MNVCMFTNTYLPHVGGVANSVAAFSEDLLERGHRVLVVAPSYEEEIDETRDEEILRVPAIQNFNGSDFSVRLTVPFVIGSRISTFEPDIIHSHHPYLLGDAALRTALHNDLPLVFTHHTLYEQYTHYVPLDSDTMANFVIHLSTEYANLCDRVIAPSESIALLLGERGVTVPIDEIPTGLDVKFFSQGNGARFRRKHGLSDSEPLIGHVGRLAPEKNLGYLAEAVALFLKQRDGTFLIVGDGPSRPEIEALFEEKALAGRLLTAGKQTGKDLADAYDAMDLFVFASKSETQGMVLTEAMAAGLPVIALDASGVREVVRDEENGRLLGRDAPPQVFADALKGWADGRGKAAQWAEGARKTADSFSREKSAEKLLRTYRAAIDAREGRDGESDVLLPWDKLLGALKAEWLLISEKASAALASVTQGAVTHEEEA